MLHARTTTQEWMIQDVCSNREILWNNSLKHSGFVCLGFVLLLRLQRKRNKAPPTTPTLCSPNQEMQQKGCPFPTPPAATLLVCRKIKGLSWINWTSYLFFYAVFFLHFQVTPLFPPSLFLFILSILKQVAAFHTHSIKHFCCTSSCKDDSRLVDQKWSPHLTIGGVIEQNFPFIFFFPPWKSLFRSFGIIPDYVTLTTRLELENVFRKWDGQILEFYSSRYHTPFSVQLVKWEHKTLNYRGFIIVEMDCSWVRFQ